MKIMGISVRTTNQNGQAMSDLGHLWERFFGEQWLAKLPTAVNDNLYCIYTDYESDYTGTYTAIIGVEVASLENAPAGSEARAFASDDFKKFIAKGNMPQAVGDCWQRIWNEDAVLNRKYSYDFEVYNAASQNGADSEVAIYIAVN